MQAQNLTIMSYNLRFDNPRDSANNWQFRKEALAQLVQKHQPDLLGTQEGLYQQIVDLADLLPDYQWIGVGRDDGKQAGEMMAIFYRPARVELLAAGHFWLSELPLEAGSRSWESACARMLTWGKFRDRHTGKLFWHFNTHFDHYSAQARAMGARLINRKLPEIAAEGLSFLTADMNFTPQDATYQIVAEKWADCQKLASKIRHQNSSFNGFAARKPNMLIDYVWVNAPQAVKVKSYEIDESKKSDGRFPSDHFPLIIRLKIL